MRVQFKSQKRSQLDGLTGEEAEAWHPLKEEAVYQKTNIQRSGWRIPGALNIDDEEDEDQALDDLNGVDGIGAFGQIPQNRKSKLSPAQQTLTGLTPQREGKRKRRYFYQLQFKVEFEFDDDDVYFAYSTPYPYSKIFM